MKLFFIPYTLYGFDSAFDAGINVIFLHRDGEKPRIFMHHTVIDISYKSDDYNYNRDKQIPRLAITGEFINGCSFQDLKDNDRLTIIVNSHDEFTPFYLEMYPAGNDILLSFSVENPSVLNIAAGMEQSPMVYLVTKDKEPVLNQAKQIHSNVSTLYTEDTAYKNIMLKDGDAIKTISLTTLAAMQDETMHDALIAMFLSMGNHTSNDESVYNMQYRFSRMRKNRSLVANRILEKCHFDESFSLLTQEEQVGTFIEFSKRIASQKKEYVPDTLIDAISSSPEYQRVKDDLEKNQLGISKTQQFNVFQQVGFFSKRHTSKDNILYNLSDMGAGKTLMTVEAIYLLDLKQISTWKKDMETNEDWNEIMTQEDGTKTEIVEVRIPDKHIIAPTLSVKSSWISTFRLFYDVTEVDETTYNISVTYKDVTAVGTIYVSPFTVKNGNIFVKTKLPFAPSETHLIVDEIHQLIKKNVAKTKFFPPKTIPIDEYKVFILSGTMSNMKTMEWYNFMRFMGMSISDQTPKELNTSKENQIVKYKNAIQKASANIRSDHHRYFDTEPVTQDNYYYHNQPKKTGIEESFYTKYGAQIIRPFVNINGKAENEVEDILTNSATYQFIIDPTESDAINFELFYELVGSKAITAQSMQVAEELFGEQKTQHTSDIIKTVSPLSKSDIHLLKVLHHIAEDYNQYKSPTIAKTINNAILNLNDGLQTQNIYDIVSKYAERNTRFFEYLAGLDVNVLEQLPKSGLIEMPNLTETNKFKVLKDILNREKDETHLIVVNDFYALKALSEALGIEHLTKEQLKRELDYQDILDDLFKKQSIVIVTQDMIKSSLDLVQANRLIQYQLNTEISDIIQTQNRINRIGQTRETRGYYIASDQLQENLIELFLESYRNIRVAHKGIIELFTDITSQINVINDYMNQAFIAMEQSETDEPAELSAEVEESVEEPKVSQLSRKNNLPGDAQIVNENGIANAILYPQNGQVLVLVPLTTGNAFPLGCLESDMKITTPRKVLWNLETDELMEGLV